MLAGRGFRRFGRATLWPYPKSAPWQVLACATITPPSLGGETEQMQPSDFGGASGGAREILRQSEEIFRLLVEGVKDYAIFMLDPHGRITTWNEGARRIKGYEAQEILGEHFSTFYTDADIERAHPDFELRVAAAEGSYEEEGLRVRKDGSTFWANVLITALRDEEGELRGFAKVTRDITTRKEAEERERLLARERAARERATDILESISDAFYAVDRRWCLTYVNNKAEELWGRPREELLGKSIWEEFPEAEGSEAHRRLERAMEEGITTEFETESPVLGAWVAVRAYPSREGMSVYFRDVTERKRAEEALGRVREVERKRIARDLHDGPLQDFSYTAAVLGMIMLQSEDPDLEGRLQGAVDAVRHGAQGLREVVNDLRIEGEEGRPFAEMVRSVVGRNLMMSQNAQVSLEVGEGVPRAPLGETGTQASRIIQEALTNARRHSGAKRISVRLRREGGDLLAEVSDDGAGFRPDASPGVGLGSMRERAALIGGHLEIESEEGRGTSVRLRAPLPPGTPE
jgi:PAS domain S-box-containing protein